MAIDLCIEGAGWMVHALDGGASTVMSALRSVVTLPSRRLAPNPDQCSTTVEIGSNTVQTAAAELSIDQATAIWFVDVCGYSYAEAGAAIGVSRETIEHRIRNGRQTIRLRVYGSPRSCN